MNAPARIYLDHAATSWPKSELVLAAMDQFARECGAAAGRGSYRSSMLAEQVVSTARRTIARRIDAPSSECISFHANGTAALNAAIFGLVRPGDHVVASAAEHNSVLRPLHHLSQTQGVRLSIVPTGESGQVNAEQMISAIEPQTRLVCLTHASNVTGVLQPVEEVGRWLREHPALFLCDAAQTFGLVPVSVKQAAIDLLAAPGHKSSGGPLGTAFLFAAPTVHAQMVPWMYGGTGSQSESLEMPHAMPGMLEAGNLNVPALAGWLAALETWQGEEIEWRRQHARKLSQRLHTGLASHRQLQVYGSAGDIPIASVTFTDLSPSDLAAILDAEFGIETRSGKHCAALIHGFLGTETEGTLRISAGHTTSEDEIDAVLAALQSILSSVS